MNPLRYLLYPPQGDEPAPHPLILFLHGIGERGDNLDLVKKWGLPKYAETGEVALPAYIAAPQCPIDQRWEDVLDPLDALLADLLHDQPIDAQRVYLTGFSLGGYGTWHWALRHPTTFAALMPVGGSGRPGRIPLDADLSLLKDVPIWMVHSAKDTTVPVEFADGYVTALVQVGANFGYTRYPDADHGETADRAFRDMTILNWLLAQKRGS